MNEPLIERHEQLIERLKAAGVKGDLDRWSAGIDHHPKSEELVRLLESVDYLFFDNCLDWNIGGDGDNGEVLAYELDVIFELLDKENS